MVYIKKVEVPHACVLPEPEKDIWFGSIWRCDECGKQWELDSGQDDELVWYPMGFCLWWLFDEQNIWRTVCSQQYPAGERPRYCPHCLRETKQSRLMDGYCPLCEQALPDKDSDL